MSGIVQPALAAKNEFMIAAAAARNSVNEAIGSRLSSPQGRYVAWIDEGSLVVALAPEFKRKTLASREQGVVIAAYPSGDGRTIFYYIENVRSSTGGVATGSGRTLLQIDAEHGGVPKLVVSGDEVPFPIHAWAPDGRAFIFVKGNVPYEYRLNAEVWQRRQLLQPEAQHDAMRSIAPRSIVYSPDSMHVAFVSQRKAGQSYLAIHDIGKGETRYIEPGIFRDRLPVWSPDGAEVVFVREPGNWTMRYRFAPQRAGVPWSIVAADVKTATTRTIWTADPGPGSVATCSKLIWTPDGRILFTWEKTGWNLLYAVPVRGGAATLLTPGEAEVANPVLSPNGDAVVYDANMGDLGRRHVWSVSLKGGVPQALTSGRGVEYSPRYIAGGYFNYRVGHRERGAPQLLIRGPNGTLRALDLQSARVARKNEEVWSKFLPVDVIQVRADDGLVSHNVIIEPGTPAPRDGYPVVIYAHGGPGEQNMPGGGRFEFAQYLASRGYLFVDLNYRGSTGFGLDFRLPEGRGATGGSEVKDVAALVRYLKGRGDVNPRRMGIVGASYGGHIVGLALTRLADDFATGVSAFGVADWVVEMKKDQEEDRSEAGGMSAPPEFIRLSERTRIEDLAYDSSPSARIDRWRAPTLFTMGDLDNSGHMESVIDLGYRLLDRGVPVEFHIDPAGTHGLFPAERIFGFLEKHLE